MVDGSTFFDRVVCAVAGVGVFLGGAQCEVSRCNFDLGCIGAGIVLCGANYLSGVDGGGDERLGGESDFAKSDCAGDSRYSIWPNHDRDDYELELFGKSSVVYYSDCNCGGSAGDWGDDI